MTIAAGFVCTNGIVIAADTQFSSHVLKVSRTKIQSNDRKTCVIAASGADVLMDKAVDGVLTHINETMDVDDVRNVMEEVLQELYVDYIDPTDNPNFDVGMLVAMNAANGAALLQHNRWSVAPVRHYACVGTGAVLGTYVADRLWGTDIRPCITASIVAAHTVQVAKRYDPWCGKETEIFVLPTNGVAYQHTPRNINNLEHFFDSVEAVLRPLLLAIPDPSATNETVEDRIKRFEEGVRATRPLPFDVTIQLTGVSALGLAGQLTAVNIKPTEPPMSQAPEAPPTPIDPTRE